MSWLNCFKSKQSYQQIDGKELEALLTKNKVQMIDVRSASEFSGGHIKGAKNIDLRSHNFRNQLEKLDKSQPYYLYCKSGMRSAQACKMMTGWGFEHLHNLKGGLMSWRGPLER